ncbi:ABC-F type ribosomal protection protein [Fibrobacterales bacterium]|nr:ABC-F type ribosomal protection protein [Fibrobacterales bacterium]
MSQIRIQNLTFAYNSATPILQNATAHLNSEWIGLVGENGSGKSTLLKLILSQIKADSGSIFIEPPSAAIHYCEQELFSLNLANTLAQDSASAGNIWEFALDYESKAGKLRSLLKLEIEMLERWQTLSSGERKRWQVGAALNAECDILLLDEPANHLDVESQELLLKGLKEYKGLGIVISHNRNLLDSLTKATLRISHEKLHFYNLPYSEAKIVWEAELSEQAQEREIARKQLRNMKRKLQESRENLEQGKSRYKKDKAKGDSDSRAITAVNIANWAETRGSKNISILRNEVEKTESNLPQNENERELGRSVFMEYEECPKKYVLVGEKITLARGEHLHLQGENGSGKTTLIRHLLNRTTTPLEKLLVLPQEHSKEDICELISKVKNLNNKILGRVMNILAALGSPASILENGNSISPGEARKLHLAFGMGNFVWALILDEPTNHLDLPSIERLENALAVFPGALLLVCHDLEFAKKCCSTVWKLSTFSK